MPERPGNPYPGPREFAPEEESVFWGRKKETADLYHLVLAHPITLLYAPSGTGKTSLINAGLFPRFKEAGIQFRMLRVGLEPGRGKRLREGDNAYVLSAVEGSSDGLHSLAPDPDERRVLVFDQFEEIVTRFPERWTDREGFFVELARLVKDRQDVRILLAAQEEYLAALGAYESLLPGGYRLSYHLERLRKPEAMAAIMEPAKIAGRPFESKAAEKLADDLLRTRVQTERDTREVHGEFVEPVHLQIVCHELWERLPESETISSEQVERYGDASRGLATYYNETVKEAVHSGRVSEERLRTWFDRHLITLAGTRGMVFRGRRSTEGVSNEVVDLLAKRHVIRVERRRDDEWYELTHDRFLGPIQDANRRWHEDQKQKAGKFSSPVVALLVTAIAAGIIYLALAIWPSEGPGGVVRILGVTVGQGEEVRLLWLVALWGALGSFVQAFLSFASYVGNRSFSRSWLWWYLLRVPLGMVVALILYGVFRAGMLPADPKANQFGIVVMATLAGLFSPKIIDKLRELADALFRTAPATGDAERRHKLAGGMPVVIEIEPTSLAANADESRIIVRGERFLKGSAIFVNGKARPTVWVDSSELYGYVAGKDLMAETTLWIWVQWPPPASTRSNSVALEVRW